MIASRIALLELFDIAVETARTLHLRDLLPPVPKGRLLVLGAGKAAASMAEQVEAHYRQAGLDRVQGFVVVPYGYGASLERLAVMEASHPTPDSESARAGAAMLFAAEALTADDHLLMLMSGGASSLLVVPRHGVTLEEKRAANRELLRSGLPIHLINAVRKRLSAIKGGRLAAMAAPASVTTMIVSDVPGDNPAEIGSAPTVAGTLSADEIRTAIAAMGIRLSDPLMGLIADPAGDPPLTLSNSAATHVVMTAGQALAAAEARARSWGWQVLNLGAEVEGEARIVARQHAALIRSIAGSSGAPLLLLSGGETTVTVQGTGRGGRNSEYLLALGLALEGVPFLALAADTDGIDGVGKNAGAVFDAGLLSQARTRGFDLQRALANNDALGIFEPLGCTVVTGPTRTNVNDFRAVVLPAR